MLFLLPLQQSAKEINISQELRQKTSDVSTRFICNLNLRKVNLFREINHTLGSPGGQNYRGLPVVIPFPTIPTTVLYSVCGSCPYCHVSTQWVDENPFGPQTALLVLRSWLTKTRHSVCGNCCISHVLYSNVSTQWAEENQFGIPTRIAGFMQLANKNPLFSLRELQVLQKNCIAGSTQLADKKSGIFCANNTVNCTYCHGSINSGLTKTHLAF